MSDSENEQERKSIVVNDRRRFDSSGNEKPEDKEPSIAAKVEATVKAGVAEFSKNDSDKIRTNVETKMNKPKEDSQEDLTINFSSFLVSLATQALMQLGMMEPPEGMELPIDRDAAKQTIDIISILQAKTKGNLDDQEQKLIEEILHNLRISYVKSYSK